MLVKIHKSNFRYKGKVYYENSTIDLPQSEVERFPDILIPVKEDKVTLEEEKSLPPEVEQEEVSTPKPKRKSRSRNNSRK